MPSRATAASKSRSDDAPAAPSRPAVRPRADARRRRCSRSTGPPVLANLEYGVVRHAAARRARRGRPSGRDRDRGRGRAQPVGGRPVALAPRRHRQARSPVCAISARPRSRSTSSSRSRTGYDGTGVGTDEALADALRAGRVVLGYALTFDDVHASGSSACVQHPLGLAVVRRDDEQARRIRSFRRRARSAACRS